MNRAFDFYSIALGLGKLPKDFKNWHVKNNLGETLAHVAAHNNCLPPDFSQWELSDDAGWTVAHEAAFTEHLPESFNQWDLTDSFGITVKDVFDLMSDNPVKDTLRVSNDCKDSPSVNINSDKCIDKDRYTDTKKH